MSKTIANMLKSILEVIISPNQNAFVPGRSIMDNAILGYESMHCIKTKRSSKKEWATLKLDMSKAL